MNQSAICCASPGDLTLSYYADELFSAPSSIEQNASASEPIIGMNLADGCGPDEEKDGETEMMEITVIGMGLMTTAVAVAVGGLALEAMRLMLSRAFRVLPLAASSEPAAIHLS